MLYVISTDRLVQGWASTASSVSVQPTKLSALIFWKMELKPEINVIFEPEVKMLFCYFLFWNCLQKGLRTEMDINA